MVKEVVGDGEGVVDVDAVVGDEGRHLREGVFRGERGRGRPRVGVGELQVVFVL